MTLLLVVPCMASAAYTPQQQAEINGLRLSYQLGQAYDRIQLQGGDISGFNTLVDQWNAWVAANFGQDSNLLMQKMASNAANLQQPFLYSNNTTTPKGIVHVIDGNMVSGPSYTTNDVNTLPDAARMNYQATPQGKLTGDGYLGGV